MLAASYSRTGPAHEVLEVGDQPAPAPADGEVLVRVKASGINPADTKRRAGWRGMEMSHPLVIPHTDGAGEIVEVGRGIDPKRIGERVWIWNAQGGYGEAGRAFGTAAEFVAIPSEQAVFLPDTIDFAAGACFGVPAMTAYRAVFSDGPVAGLTVLVNGGAGAVGHIAVQIALAAGAKVIATVSNDNAAEHVGKAGPVETIDRTREDIIERVMELTDDAGIDRIIEVDFGANLGIDIAILKRNGTIASYSSSSKPEPRFPYYEFANKGANLRIVQGFAIPQADRRKGEQHIAELCAAGKLNVAVAKTYPLNAIADAHAHVERGSIGNIVITI